MDFNLVTNIETCHKYISEAPMALVYYSHFMSIGFALIFGAYIYFKNRSALINKIFFAFTIIFALWLIDDFIQWIGVDSGVLMFNWAIVLIFDVLFYILCLYFVYLFIDKKDISFSKKVIFGLVLLPIILWTPMNLYLPKFDDVLCVPVESKLYLNYVYFAELLFSFWIIILSIVRYRKAGDKDVKKQIILLTTGISLFLLLFFAGGYVSEYVYNLGYTWGYNIELYSFFGLSLFLGFLGYLIVKFKAFNIKLIGTQALVAVLVALIGALFFYVQEAGGKILIGVNLAIAIGFGYVLVKSVKKEIEQKEELEVANDEIKGKNVKLNIANKEISERKEELQKMADSLAVANVKLKQLDQAKSDFFARASHDLRTPLTAIKGFISLLQEGSYGEVVEQQKEVLAKVFTVSQRMTGLVEDFLSASKLEAGGMQYNFAKCKVETICKEIADMLFTKANEKGLYLDFKKPQEEMPEVVIDASRIMESVSNLVDNAVKYTEKGGITIGLEHGDFSNYKRPETVAKDEVITDDIKGPVLRIIVADTGMGIPKDGIDLLFAKYSRGKGEAKFKTKGTGLGLYVGKRMIEDNGGKVWAESDGEGLGSRFIVELPIETPKEILDKLTIQQKEQQAVKF